jgi:hypothetical protein
MLKLPGLRVDTPNRPGRRELARIASAKPRSIPMSALPGIRSK